MSAGRTVLRTAVILATIGAGFVGWQHYGPAAARGPAAAALAEAAGAPTPEAPPEPIVTPETPSPAPSVAAPSMEDASAPDVPAPAPGRGAATGTTAEDDGATSPFGLPCGLSVGGEAMQGAMVALDIMAPCRPEMQVEIEHAGLVVSAATDAAGLLTLDIPAFETPAFLTVRMADGEEAMVVTGVPDLGDIGRVAVSWQGDQRIELHAFENGAEFGGAGHVSPDAPGSMGATASGTGGFLTPLGDADLPAAHRALVYSYPRTLRDGLRLSVDVPVHADNCGRQLRAKSHQIRPDGGVASQPITLAMPGCDSPGGYLVLQNLFDGRRLASN